MRRALLDACRFDWTAISPAIFGTLFQSVMEPEEQRIKGSHYTSEANVLKVIEPLFLDDLRAEFERLKRSRGTRRIPNLHAFRQRLGSMRFLDPACGCGNFLVIAYRELRQLEIEVLRELYAPGQLGLLADVLSLVDVDQFYGIDLDEFPKRITWSLGPPTPGPSRTPCWRPAPSSRGTPAPAAGRRAGCCPSRSCLRGRRTRTGDRRSPAR